MDRRTAIRNLALVVGGAALLPACTATDPVAHYKHFDIHKDQQALVANMSETIIPRTATPGAADLGLDKFVLLMLDDCTKKEDQLAFFTGMEQFNQLTQKMMNKDFAACSAKERETVLNFLDRPDKDKNAGTPTELQGFFSKVKGLTVYGYTQSKYFMTKQVVYELVPGRYNAFVPVVNNKAVLKHG